MASNLWVDTLSIAASLGRSRSVVSAIFSLCQPDIPRIRSRAKGQGSILYYELGATLVFLRRLLPFFDAALEEDLAVRAKVVIPHPGEVF